MDESRKILPPYSESCKGKKAAVDWDELTRMYLDQPLSAKDFLEQFKNIDLTKKKTLDFLKRWETEKYKQDVKNYQIRRNVRQLTDNNLIDPLEMMQRIEMLRTRQAIADHEAAECVRHALLAKVNQEDNNTGDLAMIVKSLEVVQRIQRIAIGLPPNGNDAEKLKLLEQDRKKADNTSDVPTFVVEMNENGKFKRLKPRRKIKTTNKKEPII